MEVMLWNGSRSRKGARPIAVSGTQEFVWADPVRFRQVIRNLLTNARRYGGDYLAVDVEREAESVTITVIGDGPGVPDNREQAIFEAHERGHAQSTQPGSVGLGLAVSRELARMMGGDLTFERRNSMTRFAFTVPAFVGESPTLDSEPGPMLPVPVSIDAA